MAALLLGWVGAGSAVLVAGLLAGGLRLLAGQRIAFPGPRFWVGAVLLLLSLSTIPALLGDMAAGFSFATGGRLGKPWPGANARCSRGPARWS